MGKITMNKEYVQKNGRSAKVLITGLNNENYPVAAVLEYQDGKEFTESLTEDGRLYSHTDNDRDLVEKKLNPKKGEVYETRGGDRVTIVSVNGYVKEQPILGLATRNDDTEEVFTYRRDGRFRFSNTESNLDLIRKVSDE